MGSLRAVPDRPLDAVALVRVSKVGQRGDDLLSPELQRTAIEQYAAGRGIQVVRWIEALDESGSRARSPWWARLDQAVGMVESGEVAAVLVWKFSRAARHRRRWAIALDRVEAAGGVLESATEQLDTTTSTGRLARGMLAELAAWEAEVKGEQWKEVHARRRRLGLPHNPGPRLGYQRVKSPERWEIDPVTAPVIAGLYERYVAREGLRGLARWLAEQGVHSERTGRPWTTRGIGYMLASGFAAGLLHTASGWEPGAHPPIITGRTWKAYQAEHERRLATAPRVLAPTTVLTGLVYCGTCGHPCRLRYDRRYGPAYLWACADHTGTCKARASVVRAKAEKEVHGWLEDLARDRTVRDGAGAADAASRVAARAERQMLARRARQVEAQLAVLTRELASGLIPAGAYAAVRDELLEAQAGIEARSREVSARLGRPKPTAGQVRRIMAAWDDMDMRGRREALASLIGRVEVLPHRVGGSYDRRVRVVSVWEIG